MAWVCAVCLQECEENQDTGWSPHVCVFLVKPARFQPRNEVCCLGLPCEAVVYPGKFSLTPPCYALETACLFSLLSLPSGTHKISKLKGHGHNKQERGQQMHRYWSSGRRKGLITRKQGSDRNSSMNPVTQILWNKSENILQPAQSKPTDHRPNWKRGPVPRKNSPNST